MRLPPSTLQRKEGTHSLLPVHVEGEADPYRAPRPGSNQTAPSISGVLALEMSNLLPAGQSLRGQGKGWGNGTGKQQGRRGALAGKPSLSIHSSHGPHVGKLGPITSQVEAEATLNRGNRVSSTSQQPPPCTSAFTISCHCSLMWLQGSSLAESHLPNPPKSLALPAVTTSDH